MAVAPALEGEISEIVKGDMGELCTRRRDS